MSHFSLAVLLPPGNSEARLCDLQQRVFAATGHGASLAFPPMIPLTTLADTVTAKDFESALAALELRLGFRIEPAAPLWVGGSLYLGIVVDNSGADRLAAVTSAFRSIAGDCEEIPFNLHPAYLLAPSIGQEETAATAVSTGPAIPGFSAFHYGLFRARCAEEPADWWTQVEWEIVTMVRSRRPR